MLLAFAFDPHEVLDLVDHTAHRGGVIQGAPAMALVEPEALLGRLADCIRHLSCLARAIGDPALPVAADDEGREAQVAPALHHLGGAVDVDPLFRELAFLAVALLTIAIAPAPVTWGWCHQDLV